MKGPGIGVFVHHRVVFDAPQAQAVNLATIVAYADKVVIMYLPRKFLQWVWSAPGSGHGWPSSIHQYSLLDDIRVTREATNQRVETRQLTP